MLEGLVDAEYSSYSTDSKGYLKHLATGKYLKRNGSAMALTDKSVSIEDRALKSEERLAIILGTEGTGLNKKTIDLSDYTVRIPMKHCVDSLNVAAAGAVAFWELR